LLENLVFQIVDFWSVNDLKFTYAHLQFQNFSRGYTPGPPLKRGGEGRGGKGREGKGREGKGEGEPSWKKILSTALFNYRYLQIITDG
jgi:hypothetical protein